jgi:hypothetical protein
VSSSRGPSGSSSGARRSASHAPPAAKRSAPGPPKATPGPRKLSASKPRPGGIRPLSDIAFDEDEVLIDGFEATLGGVTVRVTAVLERTCVYLDGGGDRRLASKKDLLVDASRLRVRRRGIG